jgi:putative selenium metabolism protein SsnA
MLLGNGVVVTAGVGAEPVASTVIPDGAVVWQGERITAVGRETELRREYPKAGFLDASGGLIVPGFINLHHHFYSALARGLDPGASLTNFAEVLDRLWWRLDRALDPDTVRLSAELSLADCVRWGCTTVFDHHASPSCIEGSLGLIADAVQEAGLSAALCYEVTDRNGPEQARAGIEENLRFIDDTYGDPRLRGILGLHACFTLRDDTLGVVATTRPDEAGCHIHVAEDPIDVEFTKQTFGVGPIERLERFGLLDRRALLAHGIHLDPGDYELVATRGATIVHNPESNANNGVGRLDVVTAARRGCTVGLGTDGMSSAVLRALRLAFLMQRHASGDPSSGFAVYPDLLGNNALVARRFFDEPYLGALAPNAPADIAVIDSSPPTTIEPANPFGHLVSGAAEAPVRHTIARGRVLLRDFRHVAVDPADLAARAREIAPALWERFRALSWGTSFLGKQVASRHQEVDPP